MSVLDRYKEEPSAATATFMLIQVVCLVKKQKREDEEANVKKQAKENPTTGKRRSRAC